MRRLAFLAPVALAAAACVTPSLPPEEGDDEPAPDAAPPQPDADLDCEPQIQTVGTGYHNPGTACLDCHQGQQAGAPFFTIGGTVYKDAAGTLPVKGATVLVIDAENRVVKLPTMLNGNFYTSAQLTPPYITVVSRCPDNVPMISNFSDGDCNSCHSGLKNPGRVVFDL